MYVCRALIVSLGLILLAAAPLRAAERPLLVCYGDSITAGHGLESGQSFPDALQRDLDARGLHYKVSNQGTSGATTKDAVAGLRSILALHPAVVIVEFGGNDGLRGLPLTETRRNLDAVLTALEGAHVKVLLAGITLPPNYGADYIHQFNQTYALLAAKYHVPMLPFLLKNVYGVPGSMQADGIHATDQGNAQVAKNLLPLIVPALKK